MIKDTLQQLEQHYNKMHNFDMRDVFAENKLEGERVIDFTVEACGLYIDYSKNLITKDSIKLLLKLAKEKKIKQLFKSQLRGNKINKTEGLAALHTAMRSLAKDSPDKIANKEAEDARKIRQSMYKMNQKIINGKLLGVSGKPISRVVNLGIGGSYLGARMVCNALPSQTNAPKVEFVASLSLELINNTDLETTLFIISSKSFSTEETFANVSYILDIYKGDKREFLAKNFCAITAMPDKAKDFGIKQESIFTMPLSVGGRYSLWSAIGMPIIFHCGEAAFEELLRGGRDMDSYCLSAEDKDNPALILALLSYWYVNYWQSSTICINVYEHSLAKLPEFLQQLVMESCGKSSKLFYEVNTLSEDNRAQAKSEILWGGIGTAVQHSYMQLCHQGDKLIPTDFIFGTRPPATNTKSSYELDMHKTLIAHALAQTQALLMGRTEKEARDMVTNKGLATEHVKHLVMPGNRPSNCIVYKSLTAYVLGNLIALYEHKTVMFGYLSDINPFDQWGVELGKQLSKQIKAQLVGDAEQPKGQDASTSALIKYIKG